MKNRAERRLTVVQAAGLACILVLAGCAGVKERTPPGEPAVTETAPGEAVAAKPPRADAAKIETVAAKPEARPAVPPAVESAAPVVKAEAPAAQTSPKAPVPAPPPAAKPSPPPVAKPLPPDAAKPPPPGEAKPPTLDLAALEKRLKQTSAIGIFTKLTLKNQVDELLDRFREHYEGRARTTLAQLRQPYDTLILKVLTLLQDNDPSLARAVAESREAIWGILSDPEKFRNL